jgi:predicted nucleic acid-binding Zn ribbon protein
MPLRQYICPECDSVFETLEKIGASTKKRCLHFCEMCNRNKIFHLQPANSNFCLGGANAVSGSGFHATDYGKSNSDLVAGRAREASDRLDEIRKKRDNEVIARRNAEKIKKSGVKQPDYLKNPREYREWQENRIKQAKEITHPANVGRKGITAKQAASTLKD